MAGSALLGCLLFVAASGCGKDAPALRHGGPSASLASADGADESAGSDGDAGEATDPLEERAWAYAADGGPGERMHLAERVGCAKLRDRASSVPALRRTALGAMAFCTDFSELPWLAAIGTTGEDDDAALALDDAIELAARPRRATDPDDADDLHAGCQVLLALARSTDRPAPRRVLAIRALRMLSERGCVQRADIPTDLDAKSP